MALRPKTKHRLSITAVVVLCLGLLGGGGYVARKWQMQRQVRLAGDLGVKQFEAGDYAAALPNLSKYVSSHQDDADRIYYLAKARWRVPHPENKHLVEVVRYLRRVVALKPGHPQATRDLLELYGQLGAGTEALALANGLLRQNPEDSEALRARARALVRLNRLREALEPMETLNRLHPEDLGAHLATMDMWRRLDRPPAEIVDRAEKLLAAHPGNPAFLLIKGFACDLANRREEALKAYRAAAATHPRDKELVSRLAYLLDTAEQFAEATAVLEKAAADNPDPGLRLLWARRLFETEQLPRLIGYLADLDPAQPTSESELLGLRALALIEARKLAEARPLAAALATRSDAAAGAWAQVLGKRAQDSPPAAIEVVQACRQGLLRQGANPYLFYLLAEASVELGEEAAALGALNNAAALAPAWHLPRLRAAELLAAGGRSDQALQRAMEARRRTRNQVRVEVLVLELRTAGLREGDAAGAAAALKLADEILQAAPNESRAVFARIEAQARSGDLPEARRAVEALLAPEAKTDPGLILRLASLSRRHKLDLEEQCLARVEAGAGPTPQTALMRAMAQAQAGNVDQGLALLRQASAGAAGDPAWKIAEAQFLEAARSPQATAAWGAVADAQPERIETQLMVLKSVAAWNDRQLTQRCIDRLRRMQGEASQSWRLYHVRQALLDPADERKDAALAHMLDEMVRASPGALQPRLYLAQVMERLGNFDGAVQQLKAATSIEPESVSLALGLAGLLIKQGERARAEQVVDDILRIRRASIEELRSAAQFAADLGRFKQAEMLMDRAYPRDTAPADLALCQWYWKMNLLDKAQSILGRLMEKPTLAVLRFAAAFHGDRGQMAQAQAALALLDQVEGPEHLKALVRADFQVRYVNPETGRRLYPEAVAMAPAEPEPHLALARYLIQARDAAGAAAALRAAVAAGAAEKRDGLQALVDHVDLVQSLGGAPEARDLLLALSGPARQRPVVVQTLRLLEDAGKRRLAASDFVDLLRPLADQHLEVLPLQLLAVRASLLGNRAEDAVVLATRCVQYAPHSQVASELAYRALLVARRHDEALAAARQWRERFPANPAAAMAIVEAQLRLGDPRAALRQIEPYLAEAVANPDEHHTVIVQQCHALVAAGQVDQARRLLTPLLPKDPGWRAAWIRLAAYSIAEPDVAAAWLRDIQPLIPAGSDNELLGLGQAWQSLAQRTKRPDLETNFRGVMDTLLRSPAAAPTARLGLAIYHSRRNELDEAEKWYRQVLHGQASPLAQNNLAMLLMQRKGDAAEALDLATKAVEASQRRSPHMLDTLGLALAYAGRVDQGVATLRELVKRQSRVPDWQIHLAEVLVNAGRLQEAGAVVEQFDRAFPDSGALAEDLRTSLEQIRRKLKAG